jgi:outer membrane murein-binding lipoprotein Lpp
MRAAILATVLLAGCAKSGMGEAVRTDVTARMESARGPITDCYAKALKLDRKLRGMIVLQFTAAAGTGKFEQISVLRDDMNDAMLQKCVIDSVALLKLATPQKSNLSITYPLDFAPTK